MSVWGTGILQNDIALAGIAEMASTIEQDIVHWGDRRPTEPIAGKLAAALGLLLQFSPSSFSRANESSKKIREITAKFQPVLQHLPVKARQIMQAILSNQGADLASRSANLPRELSLALFGTSTAVRARSGDKTRLSAIGKREAALFEHAESRRYVQTFAERCMKRVERDFRDPDILMDLCHESGGIGALSLLLVIEPYKLDAARVTAWRKRVFAAFDEFKPALHSNPKELEFLEEYYRSMDVVFTFLVEKA